MNPKSKRTLVRHLKRSTAIASCLILMSGSLYAAGFGDMVGGIGGAVLGGKSQESGSAPNGGSQTPPVGAALSLIGVGQSSEEEIQVGDGVAGTVLGASKIWNNAIAQKYVNLIGRNLAQHSERPELPWSFVVIDTSSINAFAAPGGTVMVTRGLYEILDTEDELASVLAHEIAHVNRQHHFKVIKKQELIQFGASQAQGAGKGNAITGRLVGIGGELLARGLDKDAEYEADRDAMVIAARAGYDSSSILNTLEKLHSKMASDNSVALLFKTHPAPDERIAKLTAITSPEIEAAAVLSSAAQRITKDGK